MDEKFIERAIKLAETKSDTGLNGPFGAVVVKDQIILGEGWNRVVELNDPTAHAEIMAIRNACSKVRSHILSKCILYTSCEPCSMCLSAIYWARIPKVVFACTQNDATQVGFDDRFIYSELNKPWEERTLVSLTLLRENALKVFDKWNNNPHKIHY